MRILPRHLRDLLVIDDIVLLHKTFAGTPCVQINIAFIEILKQWPLYGSTMFKVTVSDHGDSVCLPAVGITRQVLHVLNTRTRMCECKHTYESPFLPQVALVGLSVPLALKFTKLRISINNMRYYFSIGNIHVHHYV